LKVKIRQAVAGEIDLDQNIHERAARQGRRAKAFKVPPRVLIDNLASVSHTVIETNGKDRPGVLYAMTKVLSRLNLQIGSARISTYGERFVDVFYVKDLFGLKVDQERKLETLRFELLQAIEGQKPALADKSARLPSSS
jgi:[protein-PII] uridylyltransferase